VYGTTVENNETLYSGGSGTIEDPYIISNLDDLKELSSNPDKYFLQDQNIDLSSIEDWAPIGTSSRAFTGSYDGNGYSISNLKITSASNNVGLFGYIGSGSEIKNVNLINSTITNSAINFVGSLVGYSNGGNITSCSSINGSVVGGYAIGGLVGVAKSSIISNSYFIGKVTSKHKAKGIVGGLVGYTNTISENNSSNLIQESYANAIIDGGYNTGGLIGDNTGIVKNSFSYGSIIHGTTNTGGLIGQFNIDNLKEYKIENCFSSTSFNIDNVTTSFTSDGLIGNKINQENIVSSFWEKNNIDYKNLNNNGLTASTMKNIENYLGWNFDSIWSIDDITNNGYPYLVNLPKQKLRMSGDFSVEDKEFNGTDEVAISSENLILSGIFIDEDNNSVNLNPVASFKDIEIGENKAVDLSYSYLTGKYTFLYELDFTDSPTAFGNIYGYADYTKIYYVQGIDDGDYTLYHTTTESGLVGNTTTISSISIDGFAENINHPESKIEGEISIDNPLVLKRFYDRNIYSVIFKDYDGSIIDTQEVKHRDDAVSPSLPVRVGYEFLKWDENFTDITNNLTVTAVWKAKGDVIYTVNHYNENLDGNYILNLQETNSGTTDTTVSAAALSLDGFILNKIASKTSGVINADGSLELDLYYDRNLYTVTFWDYDGSIINTQEVKHGDDAVLPENPYRSGYRFSEWNGIYENITEDTIIVTEYIKRKSKSSMKNNTEEEKVDKILEIQIPSVENHWSKEAVKELVSKNIIINYHTFKPEENITRGEFADYITRALDLYEKDSTYKINFTDIDDEHLLSDSVKSALKHGIIKGYEDNTFRPEQTITRQEAMVMYARAINLLGFKLSQFKNMENYKDFSEIGNWAFNDVQTVVSAEVFRGTNKETLSPLSTFKYSEAAESIRNLLYIESTH
ncbi:MAG: S-layer homology domain-containing protein, partial [Bacillota bacterium]|nr:S-layer homology domain-containing protein [Bacillota bacterium]